MFGSASHVTTLELRRTCNVHGNRGVRRIGRQIETLSLELHPCLIELAELNQFGAGLIEWMEVLEEVGSPGWARTSDFLINSPAGGTPARTYYEPSAR
jgi:hypothetical protein